MKIVVSFLHLEHTPALDERIREKSAKMKKYFHDKGTMKWSCYVKNGEHYAEIYYQAPSCEYHAKAWSDNLYHSIDMAIEKIETQVYKKKEKFSKLHRENPNIVIVDPDTAWMDYNDDEDAA